jgi:hypothetical protein
MTILLFSRISPLKIITNHFETFYDARDKKFTILTEIIPLLIIGALIAYFLPYQFSIVIGKEMSPYIIGGFSVAGGFLINSLMVLAEKRTCKKDIAPEEPDSKLLKETFYNTSFGVLICLLATLSCILYPISEAVVWTQILSSIIYFLTTLFFHTVLMVLKRLSKIFDPD